MQLVLVADDSGTLGLEVGKLLHRKNIPFRALVCSQESAGWLRKYTGDIVINDFGVQAGNNGCSIFWH